ncbi:MAG: hydrogenase 4 subunit B, partial [Terriglobia bacterium]|nr:hydrogenase 4 subunit B [Terriglobia bacterium]
MPIGILLWCVFVLLALALAAICFATRRYATPILYAASALICGVALFTASVNLTGSPATLAFPLGLPWIGAHFRLDALSSFFLVIVNLGATAASLYGIGYGQHESAPARVLPFFPAFLAGMNL